MLSFKTKVEVSLFYFLTTLFCIFLTLLLNELPFSAPVDNLNQVSRLKEVSNLSLIILVIICLLIFAEFVKVLTTKFTFRIDLPKLRLIDFYFVYVNLFSSILTLSFAVLLRGTRVGFYGGDANVILKLASEIQTKGIFGEGYPPLFSYIIQKLSYYGNLEMGQSLKVTQLLFIYLTPLLVFLAWRNILNGMNLVFFTMTATIIFISPYKPYSTLTLLIIIPLLYKYTTNTQNIRILSLITLAISLLFLTYSGYFQYLFIPFMIILLRQISLNHGNRVKVITNILVTASIFFLISGRVLQIQIEELRSKRLFIEDTYFSLDYFRNPTYVIFNPGENLGNISLNFPPYDEIPGITIFTLGALLILTTYISSAYNSDLIFRNFLILGILVTALMRFFGAYLAGKTESTFFWTRTGDLILLFLVSMLFKFLHERLFSIMREITKLNFDSKKFLGSLGTLILVLLLIGKIDLYSPSNDKGFGLVTKQAYSTQNAEYLKENVKLNSAPNFVYIFQFFVK